MSRMPNGTFVPSIALISFTIRSPIRTEKPDVILLDWLMPLMDGGQMLDHLGASAGKVPIIVISGEPAPGALDPRVQAWLTKPVTIDELVTEIEHRTPASSSRQVR